MIEITTNVRPALVNTGGKTYLIPIWMEVPADFDVEKNVKVKPILVKTTKEEMVEVLGSKGDIYKARKHANGTFSCTCWGYKRAKDGKCKHIKQAFF
jgi:hypothetical protein